MIDSGGASTSSVTGDDVIRAVQQELDALPQDVRSLLGLSILIDSVQRGRFDWIVPVEAAAPPTVGKSYELHRVLSTVQENAETALRQVDPATRIFVKLEP